MAKAGMGDAFGHCGDEIGAGHGEGNAHDMGERDGHPALQPATRQQGVDHARQAVAGGRREQSVWQGRIVVQACVGLAFACNLALQVLGVLLTPGSLAERLTAGLILGNRNVGLVWSAMGAATSPMTALFFAATQFPIYMTPRLIGVIVWPKRKENPS
ncbi:MULTISPECIES: hypothetical protein [unclassified Bradyrhizobium]|uniref:hypothetical protein n=1 Tax=unclassified Bradyrhizobium TaxID=2631580 RepID=UPI002479AF70|nr:MULTISPECIES: hypothetical protein [unclassified Bradyrhizobium]WGS20704.1 hypothetical protein MTX22_02510 [Bradyrhizobium sp. ISRA463]WGS27599.1 hypothetical protein MTX19_00380 [Bradyrhizobium sp. ISRA464]